MKKIRDEEVAPLWAAYFNGCTLEQKLDLRNRLTAFYFPLVRYHAERLASTLPPSVDVDDLISMGSFGLIEAVEKFDPARGFQFKTYAAARIRGAILDGMRTNDWVARLVRLRKRKYDAAVTALRAEMGRDPLDEEIRAKLKMTRAEYETFLLDAQSEISVFSLHDESGDSETEEEAGLRMIDLITDRRAPSPLVTSLQEDNFRWMLLALTRIERTILLLYFGCGMTMQEVAEELALTESRVCQIYSRALERLREYLPRHNYLERNT